MFNMGGPIKQGIMHGIREPKRDGGKMLLVGQHPKEFQDTSGREKHVAPLVYGAGSAIARAIPAAYRGFKAAKYFEPGKISAWGKLKNILSPSGRFRGTTATMKKGTEYFGKTKKSKQALKKLRKEDPEIAGPFQQVSMTEGKPLGILKALRDPTRFGQAIGENPLTAAAIGYGALGVPRNVPDILSKGADVAKWGGRKIRDQIFGDLFKDPETPTGIEKPGGFSKAEIATKKTKTLTDEQRKDFAKSQRDARVQKYMDLMGYDKTRKNAAYDALIDAGRMVSERGTLDPKNITSELINPIVAATSKRFDKPEQIREAVGLMMSKADLEKEMYEAKPGQIMKNAQDLVKTGRYKMDEAIAIATKGSKGLVSDIQNAVGSNKVNASNWLPFLRATAAEHNEELSIVTEEMLKKEYGDDIKEHPTAMEIIEEREKTEVVPDGVYQIGQETIRIKGGKKTQIR